MNTFDWYYLLLTFPYTLFGPRIPSIWISYGAKCIPILYLIWTIIKNKSWTKPFDYSTKIAAGLVASVIGDVYILNMEEISKSYMINGIIFFALAHIFYISAMKVKNFRYFHLLIVVMLFSLAYIIIHHQLIRMNYWQQITIPAYILIILTMAYRASLHRDSVHIWNHIPATRMAAISFVISDSILGLTEITGLIMIPKYVRHVLILSFYYFSQYCFTKSAILHI